MVTGLLAPVIMLSLRNPSVTDLFRGEINDSLTVGGSVGIDGCVVLSGGAGGVVRDFA